MFAPARARNPAARDIGDAVRTAFDWKSDGGDSAPDVSGAYCMLHDEDPLTELTGREFFAALDRQLEMPISAFTGPASNA